MSMMMNGQVDRPLAPADAIAAAHADLAKLPSEIRRSCRYLSLYNVPFAERRTKIAILNGHANGLSREPDITQVSIVPGTQLSLVRVVLLDYGWSTNLWERLVDPYFTAIVETELITVWQGGVWPPDGRYYAANTFRWKRTVKQQALAPWLTETPEARRMLSEVVSWTQSKMPVVSAQYFLDTTSASEDRSPNYYDFLGVKDEKTWDEAVGLDVKAAIKFPAVARDAVSISEITKYDRGIVAFGKIKGTAFKTRDHGKAKAGDALRVLGAEADDDYDATETIGALPNGLLAFGLFNKQGVRQDKAPDNIVKTQVHTYRSCIECHDKGFRDTDSWAKHLLTAPLDLQSPDYETSRKLRREYINGLKRDIDDERAKYNARMKEATDDPRTKEPDGLDAKQFAVALTAALNTYEAPVSLETSAADMGTTAAAWKAALVQARLRGRGNTVLSPLEVGQKIPRAAWEKEVPNAHQMLRAYQQ